MPGCEKTEGCTLAYGHRGPCNADLAQEEIWHRVHEAHRDRQYVKVTTEEVTSTGRITGISNADFTLAELFAFPFAQVLDVELLGTENPND